MEWTDIKAQLEGSTKSRLTGLDSLIELLKRQSMDRDSISELTDLASQLLLDNNFKVAQNTLVALQALVVQQGDAVRPFATMLLPLVVERLGDMKQTVRQGALDVLVALLTALRPDFVFEKLHRFWSSKSWRVRHGLLQTLAEAISRFGPAVGGLRQPGSLLMQQIVKHVEDSDSSVRDASVECLEELYRAMGESLVEVLVDSRLRPATMKEVMARLSAIAPVSAAMQQLALPAMESRRTSLSGVGAIGGTVAASRQCSEVSSGQPLSAIKGILSASALPLALMNEDGVVQLQVIRSTAGAGGAVGASSERRGGFKDGGGINANGEVPPAVPFHVSSDKELREHLADGLATQLGAAEEWQVRCGALLKLEGLVLGGAAAHDSFVEQVTAIREALARQLQDRRSSVSRQVCQLISRMAAALGLRFEGLALYLLPTIFTVLPITVQVMAEAADSCVLAVLQHVHSPRLAHLVCGTLNKEKNPKVRQHAAVYLLLILEDWSPSEFSSHPEELESAISRAAQDSLAETRVVGRQAFAAYAAVLPDRAGAMLRRLDNNLQDKLAADRGTYVRGAFLSGLKSGVGSRVAAVRGLAAASSTTPRPATAPSPSSGADMSLAAKSKRERVPLSAMRNAFRASSTTGSDQLNSARSTSSAPDIVIVAPMPPPPPPPMRTASSRKSIGVGAARVLGPEPPEAAEPPSVESTVKRPAARRASSASGLPPQRVPHTSSPPSRVSDSGRGTTAPPTPAALIAATEALSLRCDAPTPAATSHGGAGRPPMQQAGSSMRMSGSGSDLSFTASVARPATVGRSVAAVLAGPKAWSDKVEAHTGLTEVLRQVRAGQLAEPSADVARDLERVVPRLIESVEDAHLKVVLSALECLHALTLSCPRAVESSGCVDRLLPALVLKVSDHKEQVRHAAMEALTDLGTMYSADLLFPGLLRSLETIKAPRSRIAVLEFAVAHLGQGLPAGAPSNQQLIKQWLSRLVPLLSDKAADMRVASQQAVDAAYRRVDSGAVVQFLQQSSGADAAALRRVLTSASPDPSLWQPTAADPAAVVTSAPAAEASRRPVSHKAGSGPESHPISDGGASDTQAPTRPAAVCEHYEPADYASPQKVQPEPGTSAGFSFKLQPASPKAAGTALDRQRSTTDSASSCRSSREDLCSSSNSVVGSSSSSVAAAAPATAAATGSHNRPPPLAYGQLPAAAASVPPATAPPAFSFSQAAPPAPVSIAAAGTAPSIAAATKVSTVRSSGSAAVPDPSAQSRTIALLAARLQSQSSDANEEALLQLAELAASFGREAWGLNFSQVMLGLMQMARHSSDALREQSLVVVRELARHQPALFGPVLDVVMPLLLSSCADGSKEVVLAANNALLGVVDASGAPQCVALLARSLPSAAALRGGTAADGPVLSAAIRGLTRLVPRVPVDELEASMCEELLPGLFAAFDHVKADVRKTVVFCLVAMWLHLGKSFNPHLSELTPAQYKLLQIYASKTAEEQGRQ